MKKTEALRFGFFIWRLMNPHQSVATHKSAFRQSAPKSGFRYGFSLQKLNSSQIRFHAQFSNVLTKITLTKRSQNSVVCNVLRRLTTSLR
jgi:hypothetical protein